MDVYHFLPTRWALDDIEKRRLRISEIDQLNDPFELWCVSQENRDLRRALGALKKELGKLYGVLCFSRNWNNPLLWSHYADKHRGMCLGFEIDERRLEAVTYVPNRQDLDIPPTEESMKRLLFTKFIDWQYEKESRGWFRLDERDGDHFFYPFDEHVQLREVIAGPLCEVTEEQIKKAVGNHDPVGIVKARLAFKTFRVVRKHWGFNTEDI